MSSLARHSLIDLTISTAGDTHIDAHHTVEDTAIVLGQAIREALGDPTAHAEILAMRAAAEVLGDGWRLENTTLAVTVEPSTVGTHLRATARIDRYAAGLTKGKGMVSSWGLMMGKDDSKTFDVGRTIRNMFVAGASGTDHGVEEFAFADGWRG